MITLYLFQKCSEEYAVPLLTNSKQASKYNHLLSRVSHDECRSQCGGAHSLRIMVGVSGQAIVAHAPPSIDPISDYELRCAVSKP